MAGNPTNEEVIKRNMELEKKSLKNKGNEEKMERLNLVLRTIRNVNQLLVKETDPSRLIQGICNNLIENRGYYNAWIAVLDASGDLVTTAQAGLDNEFDKIVEQIEKGKLTRCAQRALTQSQVVLTEDPLTDCKDCPLSIKYANRSGMTVRLEHNGKVYGLLTVSIPNAFIRDKEEQDLLKEVAGDIAFGLHRIELEEEHQRSEKALQESDKRFSQIVERNPLPTFVIDNDHRVTHWNRASENLTGICAGDIVGSKKQWSPFYSDERPILADLIVDNFSEEKISGYYREGFRKSDVIEGGYEVEDFFPALGDGGKWIFFTSAPLRDAEGNVNGAIETLQDITRSKQAEEALHRSSHELGERVKELNCLYAISRLGQKRHLKSGQILQGIVDLIPSALQYSEITCARIILDDQEFRTVDFEETIRKLRSEIIVHGKMSGYLDVYYLEERPVHDEGPFMTDLSLVLT